MFTQNKLTAEQRLHKAVGRILHEDKYKALSGILMLGERRVKDDVPTACTNGRDEFYGRAFIEKLSDAELRFVIIHECYHKMYRHLLTWAHLWKIDAQCANAAMDYVINLQIADENRDGFCMLPAVGGLLDEKYRGMDTARVFNLLRQKQQEPQSGDGNGDGDGNAPSGFDDHDFDDAKEMSAQEVRDLKREIDNAIRQGAMAGRGKGNGNRAIDDLLQVQVDWREVLRDFITTTCAGKDFSTWRRPNRRFMSAGVYMPSAISERVDELLIAIDTSGSIGQRDLTLFLTEVNGICEVVKPERVRILYWGSSVVGDEVYDQQNMQELVTSTKPKGGGGTDVTCVVDYMHEKTITPQAAIVLTDGYLAGDWGTWSVPVLWAILDNKSTTAPSGKTLHINSGDF